MRIFNYFKIKDKKWNLERKKGVPNRCFLL